MLANLNAILKSVSRSFYLSLRILPADVRPAMGLGYLLCRAADSVADTPLLPAEERLALLTEFRDIFDIFPMSAPRAQALAERIKASLSKEISAERILLEKMDAVITAFFALSKTDQALVQRVVVGVIDGMQFDVKTFGAAPEKGTVTAIATSHDFERYLGFVGGEPGRFWTDLCAAHRPRLRAVLEEKRADGIYFGTGLQLINILRDLPADLKNGRCYIPAEYLKHVDLTPADLLSDDKEDRFLPLYHLMIDSALERMQSGLSYVEALPWWAVTMRAAVWWPLMIGLRTLGLLRQSPTILGREAPVKMRRKDVYWLLFTSAFTLPFNRLLGADFEDMAGAATSNAGLVGPAD